LQDKNGYFCDKLQKKAVSKLQELRCGFKYHFFNTLADRGFISKPSIPGLTCRQVFFQTLYRAALIYKYG